MSNYFYDKQIRRFVEQFIRFFSYFDVEYNTSGGTPVLYRVPCRYADTNRQVSTILKNNSENSLSNVPMIVVYIDNVEYDRERMQNPTYVDKKSLRTIGTDPFTGQLGTQQSTAFTIERLMPAPYKLTVKIEVWTSNFDQKLQIFEQILPQFNPAMEIQNTDNFLDWTSLSYILLTGVTWTTRNIPVGQDDPIDVGTMTFELPIWLTVPSKLKKLGVITQVVASIYDAQGNLTQSIQDQQVLVGNRQYFTPMGYQMVLFNGSCTLAPKHGPIQNAAGLTIPDTIVANRDWKTVISYFGEIVPGVSMMYLTDPVTDRLIAGTIAYDIANPENLLFNVDMATIPSNTLAPINAVIDPYKNGPGVGLPAATVGQRYLILNPIGSITNDAANTSLAWRSGNNVHLIANANDIIEFRVTGWEVVFRHENYTDTQYVTNLTTNIQYKWTGKEWLKSYDGVYPEGFWSIVI